MSDVTERIRGSERMRRPIPRQSKAAGSGESSDAQPQPPQDQDDHNESGEGIEAIHGIRGDSLSAAGSGEGRALLSC